jgi:nucleotide-binding universal stress UspA family protein
MIELRHIVVATDESESGRNAVRRALALAVASGARVTLMTVLPPQGTPATHPRTAAALARFERWADPELAGAPAGLSVDLGVANGVPGIEICRFAEDRGADLLVLGRKQRSQMARLLVGDTADAVTRRSRVPCLLVPTATRSMGRVIAAADGSARGMVVIDGAMDFARAVGASVRIVTVDPVCPGETRELAATLPSPRVAKLHARIEQNLARAGGEGRSNGVGAAAATPLEGRHGDIVDEVIAATVAAGADVLVVGYHRGGPAGVVEGGSSARRLAHVAPCAVLTIPL